MAPELEKPRVTEIQVRMDCNGCVQKIKKALHGINGIYDLYIDFPQQKITIVGWADPERIVKAIKKTRKSAVICSHTETPDPPPQQTEQAPEGGQAATESSNANNPPPAEAPASDATPPSEISKDPPAPESSAPENISKSESAGNTSRQPTQSSGPKDVEEVHVIYHHPPNYGYRYGYAGHSGSPQYGGQWSNYTAPPRPAPAYRLAPPPLSAGFREESPLAGPGYRQDPPPPIYVTHSYHAYRPSPYVTEYEYVRSPPQYTHYTRPERYNEDYNSGNNSNGNVISFFSDENPNACTIV